MAEGKRPMPKGGRKGGTVFPRIDLSQAVEYSRKLVSKTHTGAQPASVVLPGVFGSTATAGKVRASALKQFGLLQGTPKGYEASPLAKAINAATPTDRPAHLKKAFQEPKLFKMLFTTFAGDTLSLARIRQQCATLKVHPESVDDAVEIFVKSARFAGLAEGEGDEISFHAITGTDGDGDNVTRNEASAGEPDESGSLGERTGDVTPLPVDQKVDDNGRCDGDLSASRRANIDIRIDPSMDPEKLEKLLGVLKKFGQI